MTPARQQLLERSETMSLGAGVTPGGSEADLQAPGFPIRVGLDARVTGVVVASVALLIALLAIPSWPVGVFQDDGIYVVLGKALAAGDGYRYINLPGAPYATHYPPGYPLFLALVWKLAPEFPRNVAVFTFANAAFLAVAAYATFRFARERLDLGTLGAGLVAVAGSVSVPVLMFGVFVLAEPMFMALLLPVLMLAERAAERGEWRDALVAGFAAGAVAMVRTTGMFVAPALVLMLLLRRRWLPALVAAAACAVLVVPWNLWVAAHGADIPPALVGKYGPYDAWAVNAMRAHGLPFVRDVVSRNARALYDLAWVMFTGGETSPNALRLPAAVCVALVLTVGAWPLSRRAPVTAWFLVAYLALVIIRPFEPTRFVSVLLPLFGAIMASGFAVILRRAPASPTSRLFRLAALGACGLLVGGFAAYNVRGVRQGWRDPIPRETAARATPVVTWVRTATRPTDVIAIEDDPLIYLYTGRRAVPVGSLTAEQYLRDQSYEFATGQLQAIITRYRPNYVVGTTSYAVISARNLSTRTPPMLRVHTLLPTTAIFAPVAP